MNILVANNHLDLIGGSECFTYALIESLLKMNHNVEYFTFEKGITTGKIESNLNVKFMSKSKYDLILANHNTCVGYLAHRGKVIQTCHGIFPELEQPSEFADYYVSISQEVKDHLVNLGLESTLIHNGINCDRFISTQKINKELKNVFSLSQSELANDKIQQACNELGVGFNKINKHKTPVWNIEDKINSSDLVVGLGRSAYDAMACGRNVLIYDEREYAASYADGILTTDKIDKFILNNCSGRYSKLKYSVEDIKTELLKYNVDNGDELRSYALKHLNMDIKAKEYLDLYTQFKKKKSKLFLKYISLKTINRINKKKRKAKK